jgi:hypothetical protein
MGNFYKRISCKNGGGYLSSVFLLTESEEHRERGAGVKTYQTGRYWVIGAMCVG